MLMTKSCNRNANSNNNTKVKIQNNYPSNETKH